MTLLARKLENKECKEKVVHTMVYHVHSFVSTNQAHSSTRVPRVPVLLRSAMRGGAARRRFNRVARSGCLLAMALMTLQRHCPCAAAPTAPDGGSREGGECQLTPTVTTIAARIHSWLDRGFDSGPLPGGGEYGYTQPSLWKYGPSQWLWDSGAAAISNSWRNTSRAVLELGTLLRAQQADGRIAEETNWPGGDVNPLTQMPVLPWTLRAIFERSDSSNGSALLRSLLPPLIRYWEWWRDTRDIDGRGLVTILHPWESGIDISPAYDAAWHVAVAANETPPAVAWLEIYPKLKELELVYRDEFGWNQTAILQRQRAAEPSALANWFMVQDVGVNTLCVSSVFSFSGTARVCAPEREFGARHVCDQPFLWRCGAIRCFVLWRFNVS
jgi:hypothetical protein